MSRKKTVGAHMTPHPHTIGKNQTMSHAAELMRAHGIRHLPVLDGGQLLGIVSDRDIALVGAMEGVSASQVRVEEAMTPEPYAVHPDADLADVVATMAKHKYGAAVVMEGNRVVGIFTAIDALQILASMLAA